MHIKRIRHLFFAGVVLGSTLVEAGNFLVTNSYDAGPGSLSDVIKAINAIPGSHQITFSCDNSGTYAQELPKIRRDVTLFLADGVSFTVNKALSGSCELTKTGQGSLFLTANNDFSGNLNLLEGVLGVSSSNSYEGSTIVQDGILEIGANAALSTGTLFLKNSAVLELTQNATLINAIELQNVNAFLDTFSHTLSLQKGITGKGDLIKFGVGSLQLLSDITYEGSLNIVEGSLELGDGFKGLSQVFVSLSEATISSLVDGLSFRAELQLTSSTSTIEVANGTFTLADPISGAGTLNKMGKGTLVIQAKNTVLHGVNIQEGTIAITSDDYLGKVEAPLVVGNATLETRGSLTLNRPVKFVGDQSILQTGSHEVIIPAGISGYGNLYKQGSGTFLLQGKSSYDGKTVVAEGGLHLQGEMGSVEVSPGAYFIGKGVVGSFVNSGELRSESIADVLTVEGDFTQSRSGVFELHISNSLLNNELQISGMANIDGALTIIPQKEKYQPGGEYAFLLADNGIEGNFSEIKAPAQFQGTSVKEGNKMLYQLEQFISLRDLLSEEKTPSKKEDRLDNMIVSEALDTAFAPAGSDFDTVITELIRVSQNSGNFEDAISILHPAHFAALGLAQESNQMLQRATVFNRVQEIVTLECAGEYRKDKEWNFWFSPAIDASYQQSMQGDKGYKSNTVAAFAGIDRQVFSDLYLGVSTGYSFSKVRWLSDFGKGNISSYYGSVYGVYEKSKWYLEGAFTGDYNRYSAYRNIEIGSINRKAYHKEGGYGLSGELGGGALLSVKKVLLQPFANLYYTYLFQGSFKETGSDSLDLKVDDKTYAIARSEIGLNVSRCYEFSYGYIAPLFKCSWIYQRQLETGDFKVSYVNEDVEFTVKGMKPNRSLLSPGIGFNSVFFNHRLNFSVFYNAEIGVKYWDQRANFQLGYCW